MRNLLALTPLVFLVGACGSDSPGSLTSGSALKLSGTLSASSSSSFRIATQSSSHLPTATNFLQSITQSGYSSALVNLAALKVHCVTSDVPPVQANAVVSANGNFTISVDGGVGKALNCTIQDSGGNELASLVLKDTSKKDMNGNSQVNSNPAFSSPNTNLGAIDLNLSTGDASVPATQVVDANGAPAIVKASDVVASGQAFDPGGVWTISDVDFALPQGLLGTCAQSDHDCNGPPRGATLYLKRLKGVDTTTSESEYGLQVWQDESGGSPVAAAAACGNKTGLDAAGETNAGVTLSAANNPGLTQGGFAFSTSFHDDHANATATITNGYQSNTATAQYDMQKCASKVITSGGVSRAVYVCGADSSGRYQANLGGGCVYTATGANIQQMDQSQVVWGSGSSCTTTVSSIAGFYEQNCSATYGSAHDPITCTNIWGIFTDAAATAPAPAQSPSACGGQSVCPPAFNYNSVPKLAAGAACSSASDALTQVNCYANYYQNYLSNSGSCLPRLNTDWSATTAAAFAHVDFRPHALVFMEKLSYSDADTASMITEQVQTRGVQLPGSSGQSNYISCGVIEKGGLSMKRINANKMLMTYTESQINTSLDKPACVAAPWNGESAKFLFYLTK